MPVKCIRKLKILSPIILNIINGLSAAAVIIGVGYAIIQYGFSQDVRDTELKHKSYREIAEIRNRYNVREIGGKTLEHTLKNLRDGIKATNMLACNLHRLVVRVIKENPDIGIPLSATKKGSDSCVHVPHWTMGDFTEKLAEAAIISRASTAFIDINQCVINGYCIKDYTYSVICSDSDFIGLATLQLAYEQNISTLANMSEVLHGNFDTVFLKNLHAKDFLKNCRDVVTAGGTRKMGLRYEQDEGDVSETILHLIDSSLNFDKMLEAETKRLAAKVVEQKELILKSITLQEGK